MSADEHRFLVAILDRLLQALRAANMSQAEAGRRIRYSQSNISNWFNPKERQEPYLLPVARLCLELGLNFGWVLTGEAGMYEAGQGARAAQARGGLDVLSQMDLRIRELRRSLEAEIEGLEPATRPLTPAEADRLAQEGLARAPRRGGATRRRPA